MTPERIQLHRTKGWRKPEGCGAPIVSALYVSHFVTCPPPRPVSGRE